MPSSARGMLTWSSQSPRSQSPRKLGLQGDEAVVAVHQRNAANAQRVVMRRLLEAAGGRNRMVSRAQVKHCAMVANLDPTSADALDMLFSSSYAYGGKQPLVPRWP